jgi:hypothetical protein
VVQNILADPRVTVQRGGKAYGAIAVRVVNEEELASLYRATAGRSPVWNEYLRSWGVEDTLTDYLAKKNRLVVLRLDATKVLPLSGLRADLTWVWPVLAGCAVA